MRFFPLLVLLLLSGCIQEPGAATEDSHDHMSEPEMDPDHDMDSEPVFFPDFNVTSHNGTNFSLQMMSDGPWIAYFSAPWCAHCETTLDAYDQAFPANRMIIFSREADANYSNMSEWHADTEESLNRSMNRPFTLGSEIAAQMEIEGIPHVFLIAADGEVIAKRLGKNTDVQDNLDWWQNNTQ